MGYFVGSTPFGFLITKAVSGQDIRQTNSGNIGATNVGRTLGFRFFLLVFFLDFLKGVLPTLGAIWLQRSFLADDGFPIRALWYLPEATGFASILGHLFPFWLAFRGGKGVATSIGVFLVLSPNAAILGILSFLIVVAATRIVSASSLAFAVVFAVTYFWWTPQPWSPPTLARSSLVVIGACLIFISHRENIKLLVRGQERRIGGSRNEFPPAGGNHSRTRI